MKYGSKHLVGILLAVAGLALTACNKNDSSGGTAATPAATTTTTSSGVIGSSNTPGYVGLGNWNGYLTVSNADLYRQFLINNGLCYRYQCRTNSSYIYLQLSTENAPNGYLPGPVSFTLSPWFGVAYGESLNQYAYGYVNSAQNGILVNYFGNRYFYDPAQTANVQSPSFQISAIYGNPGKTTLNVQILVNGTAVASGTLTGNVQQASDPGNVPFIYMGGDVQSQGTDSNYVSGGEMQVPVESYPNYRQHDHDSGSSNGNSGGFVDIYGSGFSFFIGSFNKAHHPNHR